MQQLNSIQDYFKAYAPKLIVNEKCEILQASEKDAEYQAIRNNVGLTNFSSFAKFKVSGADADTYLDEIVSGKILSVSENAIIKTLILDDQGKVSVLVTIFKAFDFYLLFADPRHANNLQTILKKFAGKYDIVLTDISDEYALIALEGPKATVALENIFGSDIFSIPPLNFIEIEFTSVPLIIARISETGEFGYQLLINKYKCAELMVLFKEKYPDITLCGINIHTRLKLEAGFFNPHNDIVANESALQAGLAWAIEMKKDNFLGKTAVLQEKLIGVEKQLVAFKCAHSDLNNIPKKLDQIFFGDKAIGYVACSDYSPNSQLIVGLAYIEAPFAYVGLELTIPGRSEIKTYSAPLLITQSMLSS